jgi:hypothetical protein
MRTIEQIPVGMSRITRKRGNIRTVTTYYYTTNNDVLFKY